MFEVVFVPNDEAREVANLLLHVEGIAVTLVTAQRNGMNDIHITNAAATKEHAIYELEKILGIDKNDMIGVGDGHNDLHLFKAVGHKVAMGNAVEELKQAADEIIGDVKFDGLAVYFEKLAKGDENER
jgi:hydroxymethylpyrimidine pyrophosphatase-like HAD family hydrolase